MNARKENSYITQNQRFLCEASVRETTYVNATPLWRSHVKFERSTRRQRVDSTACRFSPPPLPPLPPLLVHHLLVLHTLFLLATSSDEGVQLLKSIDFPRTVGAHSVLLPLSSAFPLESRKAGWTVPFLNTTATTTVMVTVTMTMTVTARRRANTKTRRSFSNDEESRG